VRYAAFLRGINLGRRRVTGPELCAPFEGLGFTEVASFLASGNVVFTTDLDTGADELERRIGSALEEALGYEVLTFLRSDPELADIVARTPFAPHQLARSTGKPQILLLPRPPAAHDAADAVAHGSDDDVLVLHGRELHWLPAGGVSQSELDLAAIGRAVGPVTIRTANTLSRMHARFFTA
jgi:uncharacterized protein (DUF1697 family)